MSWSDKLERRFGFLAIPGLLRYIAALNGVVFILYKWNPDFIRTINLDPEAVMHGEVWRLVTYIFIPQIAGNIAFVIPTYDWLNAALFIYFFLIWIGDRLEEAWGSFRLNLFYLIGMIGTTVAAFLFGAAFSNTMLNTSLFFAFASFYPDMVIYVAYILPMKVKWIAWFSAALLLWQFLTGSMQFRGAVLAAMANYFIFFGRDIFLQARHRREVTVRRQRFESEARSLTAEPLHKCKVCGATEVTDPNREFRVASDGEEYCLQHLPSAQGTPAS